LLSVKSVEPSEKVIALVASEQTASYSANVEYPRMVCAKSSSMLSERVSSLRLVEVLSMIELSCGRQSSLTDSTDTASGQFDSVVHS
jgi:hypothetical protein